PSRRLHPNARKRLRAIEEYSELGAGFALAMRDLEIRGAGNILGPQQSGHIAAVGYELYCELLEFAVRRLQNLPPRTYVDVDIDLPVQAYLPDDYVPDIRAKIDLYRRLSRISEGEQLAAFAEELADRFGPLPEPVRQMFLLQELRIAAHRLRIRAIRREQGFVVLRYVSREKIRRVAERSGNRLRIVDAESAYLPIENAVDDGTAMIVRLRDLLASVPCEPAE
ncbi:MAG: transcription-repair coupling factor, partial [Thermogutta sp.]|nr:transcription-repair coupling factor [Thermogutta sp.]